MGLHGAYGWDIASRIGTGKVWHGNGLDSEVTSRAMFGVSGFFRCLEMEIWACVGGWKCGALEDTRNTLVYNVVKMETV